MKSKSSIVMKLQEHLDIFFKLFFEYLRQKQLEIKIFFSKDRNIEHFEKKYISFSVKEILDEKLNSNGKRSAKS